MRQKPKLTPLASDICDALPAQYIDMRLYISDMGMFHAGELSADKISTRPNQIPKFGEAFKNALMAIESGWDSRVDYHRYRVSAAVKRAGGMLSEVADVQRPIGNIPQPTPRKDGDNGRVPWTGKE